MNTSFKNFYQGTGRQGLTKFISVIQNFVFCAIYAFILSRFIGERGVWLAFVLGEATTLIIIAVIVFVRNKRVSFSAKTFAMLADDIGVEEDKLFERTITSEDEVVPLSEEISAFILEQCGEKRTAMYLGLCVEEIANNIVEHGFSKDGKEHSIDVRYMEKDGKKILRIRDDCKTFDPVTYMEENKETDPTSHIGIRLVMSMVKDARYINSLGLNNLMLVM